MEFPKARLLPCITVVQLSHLALSNDHPSTNYSGQIRLIILRGWGDQLTATIDAIRIPAAPGVTSQARSARLIADVAGGDRDAFAELYDLFASRIYTVCWTVLRDSTHAEEVSQEAFLKVWELAGRYDPKRGTVVCWMSMLAHSLAVGRVRHTEATRNRDLKFAVHSQHGAPTDSVGDELVRRAEYDQVRSALHGLSELQHEAILLAFYHDHTHVEMSNILGVPLGTVKSRIHDGLRRLRATLVAATD